VIFEYLGGDRVLAVWRGIDDQPCAVELDLAEAAALKRGDPIDLPGRRIETPARIAALRTELLDEKARLGARMLEIEWDHLGGEDE